MNPEELEKVTEAITAAVEKELGQYKVPKEQHYQDHLWIASMREYQELFRNSAIRTIVGIVISGIIGIFLIGFFVWNKQ